MLLDATSSMELKVLGSLRMRSIPNEYSQRDAPDLCDLDDVRHLVAQFGQDLDLPLHLTPSCGRVLSDVATIIATLNFERTKYVSRGSAAAEGKGGFSRVEFHERIVFLCISLKLRHVPSMSNFAATTLA